MNRREKNFYQGNGFNTEMSFAERVDATISETLECMQQRNLIRGGNPRQIQRTPGFGFITESFVKKIFKRTSTNGAIFLSGITILELSVMHKHSKDLQTKHVRNRAGEIVQRRWDEFTRKD